MHYRLKAKAIFIIIQRKPALKSEITGQTGANNLPLLECKFIDNKVNAHFSSYISIFTMNTEGRSTKAAVITNPDGKPS